MVSLSVSLSMSLRHGFLVGVGSSLGSVGGKSSFSCLGMSRLSESCPSPGPLPCFLWSLGVACRFSKKLESLCLSDSSVGDCIDAMDC